jgi:hypothetical protein
MKRYCLKLIEDFYGSKKAKRSGVPYINHIYEGLDILNHLGADEHTKDAYCIHPILQADENLKNPIWFVENNSLHCTTMLYTMEYRNVANRGLNCYQVDNPDHIYLSPLPQVNQMLVADKVQNRKDFLKYHLGSHPKSQELDRYFRNWLRRLEVTETDYEKLCEVIDKEYRVATGDWLLNAECDRCGRVYCDCENKY